MHDDRIPPHGDEAELFRTLNDGLVRSLVGKLGVSREVAEDAAQFAWAQLYRKQPDRAPGIGGWLFTVAKHEVFATYRNSRREPAVEDVPELAGGPSPEAALDLQELLRLVGQLKPQQQQVLGLFAQGYSYKEIVRTTGHTYTWVNRHMTEGRAALRKLLRDEA